MITTYKYEKQDGLILDTSSIAYEVEVKPLDKRFTNRVVASVGGEGLYPVQSILVSTVVNKNDDVFGPEQVWRARHTPINKPSNIEHDEAKLVGHCISCWAVDKDMNLISDETALSSLPDLFHIVNSSVIYTNWKNEDTLKEVQNLIASIENGDMYVSMECVFKGFDYLMANEKDMKLVARNDETSWLTKYLRSYGGVGKYKDYNVYRYLKDFTFSAFGFVKRPANPASIIFNSVRDLDFKRAKASNMNEFELEKKALEATISELKTKLGVAESKVVDLQKVIGDTEKQVASLKTELDSEKGKTKLANDELAAAKEVIETNKKTNEGLTADLAKANETVKTYESEKTKLARLTKLAVANVDQTRANELVDKFSSASDEMFDALVNSLPKKEQDKKIDVVPETKPNLQASASTEEDVVKQVREWFKKI